MEDGILEVGDRVRFDEEFEGKVSGTSPTGYFIALGVTNTRVFEKYGLDPETFCRRHYKDTVEMAGSWPFAATLEDLTRAVRALQDNINKTQKEDQKMSTEELKIGDRVEVLNDAHPAMKPGDIVEVVRFDENRCGYANRARVKFVKGKPKAGEGLEDHPFPWLRSVEWRKVSSNKTIESPQETLIRFMYAKQAKLGPEVNYFTFRDAEAIAAWPTIECKHIIEKMFEESKSDHTLVGPDACPFCWKHDECKTCEWGHNHGMCKDEESDYHRASRKTEIKNLELNGLIDILGSHSSEPSEPEKPKMSQLKIWENRSEDDPDDQIYLYLTEHPDPYIRLVLVDYNGDEVESPTLLIFDTVAGNVTAPVSANPKYKELMETTGRGEIKIH